MEILYEDADILVVKKPAGVSTQTAKLGEKDIVSELKNYRKEKEPGITGEPYIGVIHRLDQLVEGILVFAKNPEAAGNLSRQIEDGKMDKQYLAVVVGTVEPGTHTLVDYLKKNGKTNTTSIAKPGEKEAKRAELTYTEYSNKNQAMDIIRDREQIKGELHVVKIHLFTGRHHQIRVQMANAGMPLLGDRKYGSSVEGYQGGLNLCAYKLSFQHPKTKKEMNYRITPTNLQIL